MEEVVLGKISKSLGREGLSESGDGARVENKERVTGTWLQQGGVTSSWKRSTRREGTRVTRAKSMSQLTFGG